MKKKKIIFILLILIFMAMILIGILLYCRNKTKKECLKQQDILRNTSFIIAETQKIRYKEIPELYIDYLKKEKDLKILEEKFKNEISSCLNDKIPKVLNLIEEDCAKLNEEIKKIRCQINILSPSDLPNSSKENIKKKRLEIEEKQNELQKKEDEKWEFELIHSSLKNIQSLLRNYLNQPLLTNYYKNDVNYKFHKYNWLSQEMQNLNKQYDDYESKSETLKKIKNLIKDKLKKRQLLISIQILRQYEDEINKFVSKKNHQEDFINYQLANNEIKFYLDMAIEKLIDVKETWIEKIYHKFLAKPKTTHQNEMPIEEIMDFVEKISQVNLSIHADLLENLEHSDITSYIEDKMVLNIAKGKDNNCWDFLQDQLLIQTLDVNDDKNNQLYTPSSKEQKEFTKLFKNRCLKEEINWSDFQKNFLSTEKQFNKFAYDQKFYYFIYPNTLFRFLSIGCDKLPYPNVNQFLNQVFDIGWQSRHKKNIY